MYIAGGSPSLAREKERERFGYLHVFSEGAWVRVGFVAHFAQIRLVRCVNVHVLLSVTAVGETSVTALELALKGLFT